MLPVQIVGLGTGCKKRRRDIFAILGHVAVNQLPVASEFPVSRATAKWRNATVKWWAATVIRQRPLIAENELIDIAFLPHGDLAEVSNLPDRRIMPRLVESFKYRSGGQME